MHRSALILLVIVCTTSLSEACAGVEMVSRFSWGARAPVSTNRLKTPVNHVFISHTVTPQCNTRSACNSRMQSMQNYHMNNLGWPDLGYNFVIGGDGAVYEAVGWTQIGIHTLGYNSKSIGISFIGDYTRISPNEKMLNAARKLIVCGIQQGYVSQKRELHGHRDATCTASPGDALYNIIKTWPGFVGGRLPGYSC